MNADASRRRGVCARAVSTRERFGHQRRLRWALTGLGTSLLILLACTMAGYSGEPAAPAAPAAPAPAAPAPAAPSEVGPPLEISDFQLSYGGSGKPKSLLPKGLAGLPKIEDLMQVPVTVGQTADAYVAPRPGVTSATFTLAGVPKLTIKKFYASAVLSIEQQLVAWLNRKDYIGIFVAPSPDDLVVEARVADHKTTITRVDDRRPANQKALHLVIWVGIVTKVRTIASGGRIPPEQRVSNPAHARIIRNSPVQAAGAEGATAQSLLHKNALERYTNFLSRHPGRRVDLALSSGEGPGAVVLDYLVSENKPWYAFAQISNTGTRNTRRWRERFGYINNELTGNDDILTLDYNTAGFDVAHAVMASYEAPAGGFDRLRWRVYGSWNKYTASDVGIANLKFDGKDWSLGAELIANVFQWNAFFLDAIAGARYDHHYIKDRQQGKVGEADVFAPYVGFRFERLTEIASTWGSVIYEWNHASPAHTEFDDLQALGRVDPDVHYHLLRFSAGHSFYLEPLLFRQAWESPGNTGSLAHEIAVLFRGQYAFDKRLIPQYESVIGGLYTVRGYPESVVAGDSVYVGTVEYRFHVPRILSPKAEPAKLPVFGTPFRFAPQQAYGRPDWDLIVRAFYDVGRAVNSDRLSFELDQTLQGVGVGLELRFKTNFSVRCDYGVALEDVIDPQTRRTAVPSGHKRFHTIATLAF